MTLTEKRLAANRRNAKLSRGPKTARGKARSSKNRTSHGLSARDITLTRSEKAAERKLMQEWLNYFQPRHAAELDAIQRVVRADIILRRIDRIEFDIMAERSNEGILPDRLARFGVRYQRRWSRALHTAIDDLRRLVSERDQNPEITPETPPESQNDPTAIPDQNLSPEMSYG